MDHPLLEELSLLDRRAGATTAPEPQTEARPDRAVFEAYRRGELGEEEAAAFETWLSGHEEGRRELAELAGLDLPTPSPFLRARVMRAFKKRRRRAWLPLVVAALLILSAGGLLWRGGLGPGPLPPELTYTIEAKGLADVRSEQKPTGGVIEAYAETPIELVIAPEGVADAEVDFAIYLKTADLWRRVATGAEAQIDRGTAIFLLPASQILGTRPGEYELLLAIARPGALPPELEEASVESSGDDLRLYRQRVILKP